MVGLSSNVIRLRHSERHYVEDRKEELPSMKTQPKNDNRHLRRNYELNHCTGLAVANVHILICLHYRQLERP